MARHTVGFDFDFRHNHFHSSCYFGKMVGALYTAADEHKEIFLVNVARRLRWIVSELRSEEKNIKSTAKRAPESQRTRLHQVRLFLARD